MCERVSLLVCGSSERFKNLLQRLKMGLYHGECCEAQWLFSAESLHSCLCLGSFSLLSTEVLSVSVLSLSSSKISQPDPAGPLLLDAATEKHLCGQDW